MNITRHPLRLALLASVASLTACTDRTSPDSEVGRQVAEHLCAIQAECGCDASQIIPSCEAEVERDVGRHEREAITAGATLDAECLSAVLVRIDDLSTCAAQIEWSAGICPTYSGTAGVGDPCQIFEVIPLMTNCQAGLDCREGACRNLQNPPLLQEGQVCSETQGRLPSGYLGHCADGLACDSLDTRTCLPYTPIDPVPLGGECAELTVCENGSYCRPPSGADDVSETSPGICTAPTPAGQPCTLLYECELFCEEGSCQVPPPYLCNILDDWWSSRAILPL